MGTVYLGEHVLLGRPAAIKVLLPSLSAEPAIVERFFNEAKAVTQIADPGIVQVFDFGHADDGSTYLVMELLDGETLAARLARLGRMPVLDVVRLVRLMAVSLASAHAKGIVHRDLKPENIFIVRDPAVPGGERAKILDFGIAKLLRHEGRGVTRTGAVIGTPLYMSPEQCHGTDTIDHRADIYSLGCVMVTMLTGIPPFDIHATGALIIAHVQTPPPLVSSRVPGIPPAIDHLLQRCLAKAPEHRVQTMDELARAVGQIEAGISAVQQGGVTAFESAPTSASQHAWSAGHVMQTSTTLSGAAAGGPSAIATRKRGMLLAGAGVLVVGLIVVVAVATSGGDRATTNVPTTQREIAPTVAVDAMAPPVANVQPDRTPIDAIIIDAPLPSVTETHPDAPTHAVVSPPPPTGKHHVRTTKPAPSSTTPDVDRGD
jgi:serine/threonine-protein kinase